MCAALSLSSVVLASRVLAGREPLLIECVSLGVFGGCAVGSACGQRSANIFKCSISLELRMCRAPPPVLEAMPSLVDRALLKLLGRPVSLRAPRWLVAELRLVLGQMTEEMLQTFVDREEALETSGRLEFDDFATVVGAAGPQTSPAIARSLGAAARSSEAGLRNVADAFTDVSAQTAAAPLPTMMPCGDKGAGPHASTEHAARKRRRITR